jgi:AraC-like DNA-binding protein
VAKRHDRSSEFLAGASDFRAAAVAPEGLPSAGGAQHRDAAVDVLSDVLRTIRLTGAVFFPLEASSPWADDIPAATGLVRAVLPSAQHVVSYHIVTAGTCWVTLPEGPPLHLGPGDVVVIPHGDAYVMSSAPGMRSAMPADAVLAFFHQMAIGSAPSMVVEGDGAQRTGLVCGFLGCDIHPLNPVLEALPRLLHVRPPVEPSTQDRLTPLVEFALAESRQRRSGAQNVLLRLSEVLFIEVIRRHLDSLAADRTGWLSGLRDPIVGHALSLLHDRPTDSWTLERLAKDVGVSRTALADRFTQLVGQPPMRYLARWRMQLASRLLLDGSAKVAAVAFEVGYHSEAAFSRAFKEIVGVSPAGWRRERSHPPMTERAIGNG